MRNITLACFASIALSGCATSGHQQFYQSFVDEVPAADIEWLREGQKPLVYSSDNLERDMDIMLSKGYVAIGSSAFNGQIAGADDVAAQATRVGATIAIVRYNYTNTQTSTVPLFVPTTATSYHSGLVHGYGGSASYSGTSTTSGTTVVPMTMHQRRFDQEAIYFGKSTKRPKYGVYLNDLSPETRREIQRNMGALVTIVVEDTPAFLGNVLPGDILIKVDGTDVRNGEHAVTLMGRGPYTPGVSVLTVLRDIGEVELTIELRDE